MTTPDPRLRSLDPAHILCVTHEATAGLRHSTARAASTEDAVRIRFTSRRVARTAAAALRRVGYQVDRIDPTDQRRLLVTGWSAAWLDIRLVTMRTVIHQLEQSPAVTAAAVIDRIRSLPEGAAVPADASVLSEARRQLRAWVSVRSGIHAPYDSAILPSDLGNRLRLRLARRGEAMIDGLIERHLKVAGHALSLFESLRWHMPDDQAQSIAVRHADVARHLNQPRRDGLPAAGTALQPGYELRFSWLAPTTRPDRLAASDLPHPVRPGVYRRDMTGPASTRPGGRHFPASRRGPRR